MSASMHTRLRWLAGAAMLLWGGAVHAERPMTVDDAGVTSLGHVRLEAGLLAGSSGRGGEAVLGLSPLAGLEMEVHASRQRTRDVLPVAHTDGAGVLLKWAWLPGTDGVSAALRLDMDAMRTRPAAAVRQQGLFGLWTWQFASGRVVHANLGAVWTSDATGRQRHGFLGFGGEQPLSGNTALLAELFRDGGTGLNRELGLRYQWSPHTKLSIAAGRGRGVWFANAGTSVDY